MAARIALAHAGGTYRGFLRTLGRAEAVQESVLARQLEANADSDYGRQWGFRRLRNSDEFRRAVPLVRYDDLRPIIERVMEGETRALFGPGATIRMFATTSGTTSRTKYVPVTSGFEREYRRGWNTFGAKMLNDHPRAVLRAILQSSGRFDERRTKTGTPIGAITGLMALTQKRIVRRFYVGKPEIARIADVRARQYALMRLGVGRDVAFCITASPATLIQLARVADEERERLVRDVRDGTVCARMVEDAAIREALTRGLKPNRGRARELEEIVRARGGLRPCDYWKLEFLACWTGGSMGHYLSRVRDWYGALPIRDIGLLASEGRVTIPVEDGTAAGVLDLRGAFFEFIPVDRGEESQPPTVRAWEVEAGRDYIVVLTNAAGLVRYRLEDVVRVRGFMGTTPTLEFLYRAGRVASVAGEKLTEQQLIQAVRRACAALGLEDMDVLAAPCWGDPPAYRVEIENETPTGFAEALDQALGEENEEYASRRKSGRLGPAMLRTVARGTFAVMDAKLMRERGGAVEQYKRQSLMTKPLESAEEVISTS